MLYGLIFRITLGAIMALLGLLRPYFGYILRLIKALIRLIKAFIFLLKGLIFIRTLRGSVLELFWCCRPIFLLI